MPRQYNSLFVFRKMGVASMLFTENPRETRSVQYKELKLGSHSGHAKTNLSGHCVEMSGQKVTPILNYMILVM